MRMQDKTNGRKADEQPDHSVRLKVERAVSKDIGRGIARVDPGTMAKLSASVGDVIRISGKRSSVARCLPSYVLERGKSQISMDGILRENAQVELGEAVVVSKATAQAATTALLIPLTAMAAELDPSQVAQVFQGVAVTAGDIVRANYIGPGEADFRVESTNPEGVVVFMATTAITIKGREGRKAETKARTARTSYEDIGGLSNELSRIREMIEVPLKYPEAFERLGIDPPKGVLMYGAPGSGKTLTARAIAEATDATFLRINGPEIIRKFYGESEAKLRTIFEDAAKKAPSIIFIDEIDAVAPRRAETVGDVEKRVVAQLLALMDGLQSRGQVIVIGATNIPDALDPALRRPGRFDREIMIPAPDLTGRLEILRIHTRKMPTAPDVNLEQLAAITHGFVGADLAALCREAAMTSIRAVLPDLDEEGVDYSSLMKLEVNMSHFVAALREVEPSAIRDILIETPDVKFNQIGGLAEIKQILKESIDWPLRYPQLFAEAKVRPPRGILLCGSPGTGKTTLAKALASESEANFISIKGPALFSKWVGETEKGVRELFRKARQVAPTIIFIDEIDSLAPQRGNAANDSGVAERATSQLLTELDGLEELRGVIVVAATNRRDMIDRALLRPGRFDLILDLPVPDEAARMEILKIHTRGRPLANDVDLSRLSTELEGFVGAEIESVIDQACVFAIREYLQSSMKEKLEVHWSHFQKAIKSRKDTNQGDKSHD